MTSVDYLRGLANWVQTIGEGIIPQLESDIPRLHRIANELESLLAVMDAADAFLAMPPEDMRDGFSFNQYTTAKDCRALCAAYSRARKILEAKTAEAEGGE